MNFTIGFIFCSNYEGPKARQLAENPKACLLFSWPETLKEVKITGLVEKVSKEEASLLFSRFPSNVTND
jgi:pyridoxamine 5'-phosphate oxidase